MTNQKAYRDRKISRYERTHALEDLGLGKCLEVLRIGLVGDMTRVVVRAVWPWCYQMPKHSLQHRGARLFLVGRRADEYEDMCQSHEPVLVRTPRHGRLHALFTSNIIALHSNNTSSTYMVVAQQARRVAIYGSEGSHSNY